MLDWMSRIRTSIFGAQRHGPGIRVFRRPDTKIRRIRRAQRRFHGQMQSENVSTVRKLLCFGITRALYTTLRSRLLDPNHFLLPLLGARFPLEAAVGMNGRVWVSAKEVKQTIAIARCIEAADPDGGGMDDAGVRQLFSSLEL